MIVGFTGTQQGMTEAQKAELSRQLVTLKTLRFLHGDCIGADAEAHAIARNLGIEIVIHPPLKIAKRAWCMGARFERDAKPYLQRNRDIARECEVLIAAPKSSTEELRSGTWATVRYARKYNKLIFILDPNGS